MNKSLYSIVIIHLFLLQTISSIRLGHEVGSSSMDSTHYDRRILYQQCPSSSEPKDLHRATFWVAVRSASITSNSSNQTNVIPIRRQLIINNGEDRLVTRTTSNKTNVNNATNQWGIDQATMDIIVDNQVRNDWIRKRVNLESREFHTFYKLKQISFTTEKHLHRWTIYIYIVSYRFQAI